MNMTEKKKPMLPRDWKRQVSETLAKKGFDLSEADVYNLAKGRVKNPTLQKTVLQLLKKIKEEHEAELAAIEQLKIEVAI
jgi:hypothetical protein